MRNLYFVLVLVASLELVAQEKPAQTVATGAAAQGGENASPAAKHGFDWDRVANAVAAGEWDSVSRFFQEKGNAKIARLAVATKNDLRHQLLTTGEITPETTAAAIAEAKLDAALLKASDARLVRVVNNLLYFDVPLEKVAPLGKALAAAAYGTRLLVLRGQGSFNIPRTGPQ